ncbi:MAG: large conductance mechanosensitive channel protein MscL [Clostridiales bacterium]|nr:large conductance mechanosensitive channel protein MscL [Clostridiales bacterium]
MKGIKKFFNDFKKFISKGNVFDLAVGMIIATAFNKIVSSLVNDIIMPLITWATGAASLADLSLPLRYEINELGEKIVTLSWNYGNFLQMVIDFLIIAFSVFLMVKLMTASRNKFKELGEFVAEQSKKEVKAEKKAVKMQAKAEKRKFKEVWAEHEAEKKRLAEEQAKILAEEQAKKEAEERANNPTQEELLKQILSELKKQNESEEKKTKEKKSKEEK